MSSSQSTLTRFFSRGPGSKPPPKRQSTLLSKRPNKKASSALSNTAEGSSENSSQSTGLELLFDDDKPSSIKEEDFENRSKESSSPGPGEVENNVSNAIESPPSSPLTVNSDTKKRKANSISQIKGPESVPHKKSKDAEDSEAPENSSESEVQSETDIQSELKLSKSVIESESKWPKGQPVPYAALCEMFQKVEATTKRLEIISLCSSFYLEVLTLTPESLLQVVYLSINRLCPDYEGIEIGIGESILMKAIAECTGRSMHQIKSSYKDIGDLGTVARNAKMNQPTMFKPKPLTVQRVFSSLKEIALITGSQSQNRKIIIINKLLSACVGDEAKYLVRSLEGKLRISLAEKTVLTSLAQAAVSYEASKSGKSVDPTAVVAAENLIRQIYSEMPSYDAIVPVIANKGIMRLREECSLTPGIPLKPMLAKPTKSLTEVLDRFQDQKFTCEYKYDGERAQIHYSNHETHVYSRNSEDMSAKYPDIVSAVQRFVKTDTTSFVMDCEAVAWDREQSKILPFQILSTRKRKDVQEGDIKVRVCIFAFDLLYLNGKSLLQTQLSDRRAMLHEAFKEVAGEFTFAKAMDTSNVEEIQEFLDQSVKDSCEGLMIKMLEGSESGYEPSKRSRNWLKLKKDYLDGVGDSLDLVVIGAYHGRGKRTNVYGAFLLACYNFDTQEYETICKIGTGFSEEALDTFYQQLSKTVISQPKSYYSYSQAGSNAPDVWFEPTMVWEVLAADLSLSPVYRAGISDLGRNKGISLRFPRFVRIRDDKNPEQATTSEQVCEFYNSQIATSSGNQDAFEDDY
ncbi:ATP-dependent DNA ligase [Dipodascopsis uninucleata]